MEYPLSQHKLQVVSAVSLHNALVQPKDVDNLQDAVHRLFFDDKLDLHVTNSFYGQLVRWVSNCLNWLEFYDSFELLAFFET